MRRDYERRLRECKAQFEFDARVTRERLDGERKRAVAALEEKKLSHTSRVMKEHDHALKVVTVLLVTKDRASSSSCITASRHGLVSRGLRVCPSCWSRGPSLGYP